MKQCLTFFFTAFSIVALAQTTNSCACCTPNHSQFDFWVGNWQVTDTAGNVLGTNRVEKHYDKCIVQENWLSTQVNRGTSFNYFQPSDSTWNQLWLDNQGSILNLKGSWNGNAMELQSAMTKNAKGIVIYHQISWTPQTDGSVIQLWEVFDENNQKINELFRGIYRRK